MAFQVGDRVRLTALANAALGASFYGDERGEVVGTTGPDRDGTRWLVVRFGESREVRLIGDFAVELDPDCQHEGCRSCPEVARDCWLSRRPVRPEVLR